MLILKSCLNYLSKSLNKMTINFLKQYGGKDITSLKNNQPFIFIGQKSIDKEHALEIIGHKEDYAGCIFFPCKHLIYLYYILLYLLYCVRSDYLKIVSKI
jgi:hypothetical protein